MRDDGSAGRSGSTGRASQPVILRGGQTTVMQALDDVVRQVPGLVWWLTFTPKDDGHPFMIG